MHFPRWMRLFTPTSGSFPGTKKSYEKENDYSQRTEWRSGARLRYRTILEGLFAHQWVTTSVVNILNPLVPRGFFQLCWQNRFFISAAYITNTCQRTLTGKPHLQLCKWGSAARQQYLCIKYEIRTSEVSGRYWRWMVVGGRRCQPQLLPFRLIKSPNKVNIKCTGILHTDA